ncbi:hypothetical protein GCM10010260_84150 [Streptomyces filipinensis]|uniref:Uncharacterized protein n=1 Tax=Streptomyces filipinensis TaxID=66887 RepID=A0A918ILU5_9ACTN|nr:hypothetical protein GCM10010260_84150 [Streptomyces filipinensis]
MRPRVVSPEAGAASAGPGGPGTSGVGFTAFLPVVFFEAFFAGAVLLPPAGGADEWCVAGMTAPVRVNVGVGGGCGEVGPAEVLGDACGVCTGGAFPPGSGGQPGTLVTTLAYVHPQDRPPSSECPVTASTRPDTPGGCVPTDARVTTTVEGDDETYSAVRLPP